MAGSVSKKTKSKVKAGTVKKALRSAAARRRSTKTAPAKTTKANAAANAKARTGRQQERIIEEFRSVVNISRGQLERWLGTPESKKLRFPDEPKNGKAPGSAILKLLTKKGDKITREDVDQMQAVLDFIGPRLQKRPKGDIVASNWRYSLMNWGHDPSKPLKRTRGKQNGK
jgi:hypothetical protein